MTDTDKHERAREITEQALDHYARGEQAKGDALTTEAVQLDRTAVQEVVEEIDEDLANQRGAKEEAGTTE